RLGGESSSAQPQPAPGVRTTLMATLRAIGFVFIVATVLQLVLGPLRRNPTVFLRSVLTMTIICGAITWTWVRCAQRSLWLAALSGFLSGFVIPFLATPVDIFFWPADYRLPADRVFDTLRLWALHRQIGLNALAWASWGLMGALAVNRKWAPCPSMGILA